jgi:hypothetical protein
MNEELQKKLDEVRKSIKSLVAVEEMSDAQAEQLEGFNKTAVKLQAQIDANVELDKAENENVARIEREKNEAVKAAVAAEAAKHRRLDFNGDAPHQTRYADTNKYNNLSAGEIALVVGTLKSREKSVSGAAYKALALRVGELKNETNNEEGRKAMDYVKGAFEDATGIKADMGSIEASIKAATDPMYTGGANIGSDWVGTAYSNELWQSIRAENKIVAMIPQKVVADGYSSLVIPLESTDPSWYKVAEATASDSTLKVPAATIAASQAGTLNKSLTLGKLGARVLYTGELTEDSLISFAPEMRRKLQVSGSEILEHLVIDGDVETSASKNINAIDTTPAGTEPFLLFDGFRKLALVTNTANSRSAGGALSVTDYIETLKLMGTAGLSGADPTKVKFIIDFNTHYKNMALPEALTKDVYSGATFENGFLRQAFGYEVIPSFQMHRGSAKRMANTSGKIDADTDSNNTTGAILAVRFDQWVQAFKRLMTLETTRIANADSWEIVGLMRYGLAYRDSEASAISYNVGV